MEEPTYTQALARVEEIVSTLERGECDIDQLTALIKEGKQLLAFCTKRLGDVEATYKQILGDNEQG